MTQGSATHAQMAAALTLGVDMATGAIADHLAAREIEFVLLKGPAIARWLYTPPSARFYSDADLLVSPDDFSKVERILSEAGFTTRGPAETRPEHANTWARQDGLEIDLHHRIPGLGVDPEVAWEVIGSNTDVMRVAGRDLRVPAVGLRALFVALHAVHHGRAVEKPLTDLELALEVGTPDLWKETLRFAHLLGATAEFAIGLRMLPRGRALAADLGLPVVKSSTLLLREHSASQGAKTLDWIAQQPKKRQVLRILLFPSRERLRARQPDRRNLVTAYGAYLWDLLVKSPGAFRDWRRAVHRAKQED